jgi:predicted nucleotidyltransferase
MSATNAVADSGAIPSEAQRRIANRLGAIEAREGVRLLIAVESGSRAWGFPSPDSDYDVRFLYVRPLDWYLTLAPGRDVIEEPIEGDLDINGWDVRKALVLALKPNATLLEWLRSPVIYRQDEAAVARIRALAGQVAFERSCVHHYLHLAQNQYGRQIAGRAEVRLKSYLYSLRPALALRYMRLHPGAPVPMHLAALRSGSCLAEEVEALIDALVVRKAVTRELVEGSRMPLLDQLIEAEIGEAVMWCGAAEPRSDDLRVRADALFRGFAKGEI